MRKTWWLRYKAASHSAAVAKKKRELNADAQLAFSFLFTLEPQPTEQCYLVSGESSHFG